MLGFSEPGEGGLVRYNGWVKY